MGMSICILSRVVTALTGGAVGRYLAHGDGTPCLILHSPPSTAAYAYTDGHQAHIGNTFRS
jgi:hypothetical protein